MIKKYFSFFALCLGFFIVIMDTTSIPLIYTTLMTVFNLSPFQVSLINNVYLITYAAFIFLGGQLGDFTNRKIIVLIACLFISIGGIISGLGQSFEGLLLGRGLMGIGAGLLTPQSMAYISILFTKGGRGIALGIWAAVAGAASVSGPLLTEIFLKIADWRWVMWINVPFAFACFVIILFSLQSDRGAGIKFWNVIVSSLYGLCLAGIMTGIQCISQTKMIMNLGGIIFITAIVSAVVLIRYEIKQKSGHILSYALWRDTTFLKICFISGLLGLSLTGFLLPLAFFLDLNMNFSPIAIILVMLIVAFFNSIIGLFAGNASDHIKPKKIIPIGLLLFAFANIFLCLISIFVSNAYLAFVLLCAAMIIAGCGTGMSFAPLANLVLSRTQIANVGQAVAFYNSVRQTSSALGGVIVAIVFETILRLYLKNNTEITIINLRNSSSATAAASAACFFIIALSLIIAVFISRSKMTEI